MKWIVEAFWWVAELIWLLINMPGAGGRSLSGRPDPRPLRPPRRDE